MKQVSDYIETERFFKTEGNVLPGMPGARIDTDFRVDFVGIDESRWDNALFNSLLSSAVIELEHKVHAFALATVEEVDRRKK